MSVGSGWRQAVTVVIVEDHQLLGATLASALALEGFTVLAPALTAIPELTLAVVKAKPRVALVDLDLRGIGDGSALVGPLVASGCSVIIVSGTADEAEVGRCLLLGATDWVPKSADFADLLAAVRAGAEGSSVLTATDRTRLIDVWLRREREERATLAPFEKLSRRERAVLALLMEGQSVDRIAVASFVSEATVRTQVRAILLKLGVNSQLEAVAMAARAGWDISLEMNAHSG